MAIEVDGLLERPVLGGPVPADAVEVDITFRRNAYPTSTRPEPEWDRQEEWGAKHWFSRLGVEWVKGLIEAGTEVVWASTWHEYTNVYFAEALGIPALPVAARLGGQRHESVSKWKAYELSSRFDGRPLLWVTDELTNESARVIEKLRHPRDRVLTYLHLIPLSAWVSEGDVGRMNAWLELARSDEGHHELRRLRRRAQERARQRRRSG